MTDGSTAPPQVIGVTGASGFLGSHLLDHLSASGLYGIHALSRSPVHASQESTGVRWERGDLSSLRDCEQFTGPLNKVVHFAHANTPLSSHRDWASDAALNITPTLNLIEALRRQNRRIDLVFASSGGAVYGHRTGGVPFKETDATHPSSPYGVVKLAIEHYLRLASEEGWLRVTVLRIGNPYGRLLPPERRQGLIGIAINQILRGEPVPLYGDLANIRDYVHLSDMSEAVERSLNPDKPFNIYNVGSGQGASTTDVLDLIERTSGRDAMRRSIEEIPDANRLVSWVVLDIGKAAAELDWRPRISLEAGIAALLRGPQAGSAA
jgi:UDP-glucose 4-epimerase